MDECVNIAQCFLSNVSEDNTEISIIESGLINNTFKLKHIEQTYIVQKLNLNVFKTPKIIHGNYSKVYEHLSTSKYTKHKLDFLKSLKGDELVIHENDIWRISRFIDGETLHVCNSIEMAFNAAEALAEFHFHLQDLDANAITTPIPGFCDFKFRLQEFKKATMFGNKDRVLNADVIIQEISSNFHLIQSYIDLEQSLPQRVIHGDPKVSNFLFSKEANAVLSIIDIDTIMSGMILYDFADMVRSFANKSKEDSTIRGKSFDSNIYEALKNGYLSIGKQFMMKEETNSLGLSAITIALIQCIRFLTDYLNDDIYYQVSYENQNFDRALNQFSFFKEVKDYLSL